jgi:hypothetical protein
MDARETICGIHRTPQFERSLDDLRKKGGIAETAANKALDFINTVNGSEGQKVREKYSFTRHGEARIRNCRKVDLGCGYRLVCLLKDGQLVLLYAGSHDECSRWLMRNRRMNYEFKETVKDGSAAREQPVVKEVEQAVSDNGTECIDEYEADLMSKIDDAVLRKVFSGIVNGRV